MVMPRQARQKSESGIYHIMLRGIHRQNIFEDAEDREKFLQTLKRYEKISEYRIFAYCLMSNHIHLLLKPGKEGLDIALKRIAGGYVYWYNWKYKRSCISAIESRNAGSLPEALQRRRRLHPTTQPFNGSQYCNCKKSRITQENRPLVFILLSNSSYEVSLCTSLNARKQITGERLLLSLY
jgi:hypothetical protein